MELNRFVVESPHTAGECRALLQDIYAMGYLHHFEWACPYGVHTGWATIEAESEVQARLAVPPRVRHQARVTRVTRLEPNEIELCGVPAAATA